jgi:predicted esterase
MKNHLIVPKTFRYFTEGDPTQARTLLYVLHGYGQLAEYFIRKFQFPGNDYFIVAPEGMHRFYLSGSSGRVGASWMTKEERESDISDNLRFLDTLHKEITADRTFERIMILGFSQGGATAARWHYKGEIKADHLLIWASVFPPDLSIDEEINEVGSSKNIFFIGDQDEYYSADEQIEQLQLYRSKGFESIHYTGKHDISSEVLSDQLEKIQE